MEAAAFTKSVRISPRKVRLVADEIRNKSVNNALLVLATTKKRAAYILTKTVKSALANAKQNPKMKSDSLMVSNIDVMEGPVLKRFHPTSRGRVHPYKKRSTHIKVVLQEKKGVSV